MFGNRALTGRIKISRAECEKLHNEERHNLYRSLNIIRPRGNASNPCKSNRVFSSPKRPDRSGTHTAHNRYRGLFSGGKKGLARPEHSSACISQVRNERIYASTTTCLHGKYGENLIRHLMLLQSVAVVGQ